MSRDVTIPRYLSYTRIFRNEFLSHFSQIPTKKVRSFYESYSGYLTLPSESAAPQERHPLTSIVRDVVPMDFSASAFAIKNSRDVREVLFGSTCTSPKAYSTHLFSGNQYAVNICQRKRGNSSTEMESE